MDMKGEGGKINETAICRIWGQNIEITGDVTGEKHFLSRITC